MARPLPKYPIYTLICAYCGRELIRLTAVEVAKILDISLVNTQEIMTPSAIYRLVKKLKLPDYCPHCGMKLMKIPEINKISVTIRDKH